MRTFGNEVTGNAFESVRSIDDTTPQRPSLKFTHELISTKMASFGLIHAKFDNAIFKWGYHFHLASEGELRDSLTLIDQSAMFDGTQRKTGQGDTTADCLLND